MESVMPCACGCGEVLTPFDGRGRPRRFIHGHNPRGKPSPLNQQQKVRCRRCFKVASLSPFWVKKLSSLEKGPDGLTYLCRECQSRDRLRLVATPALLRNYGIDREDSEGDRLYVMREHMGKARKRLKRFTPSIESRTSERSRRAMSIGQLVRGATAAATDDSRGSEFHLCPSCDKLIKLDRGNIAAGALGFHRGCYREYMQTPEYKLWRERIGSFRSPVAAKRLARIPHPMPQPKMGRRVSPQEWAQRFSWLLRHRLQRQSWREIADADGCDPSNVLRGVRALIDHLPENWTIVYKGRKTGRSLDDLLPIGDL